MPLQLRDGYLGPPPLCPPLPAAKPTGCMLAAPEYPLSNQNASGSVNIFDPNLQVPYSDTWTVGFQRSLGLKQAVEVRYVGTRSRAQWENFNYNEANIHENGFLNEFKLAQANLQASHRAGMRRKRAARVLVRLSRAGHRHVSAADLSRVLQRSSGFAGRRCLQVHLVELDEFEFRQPAGRVHGQPVHTGRHELDDRARGRPDAAGELHRGRIAGKLLPSQSGHARRSERHG